MTDVWDATDALITDRPELEADIQEVLDVDAQKETWAFDDVPLDSGAFGELVSSGIVEKVDDEYRLADHDAVRAALEGEDYTETTSSSVDFSDFAVSIGDIDYILVGSIIGLLGLTVVMRTVFSWGSVFRGEHIVLTGNDPYFYRYWLEELLRTDPSLGGMPEALLNHDVLMVAVTWGFATLFGGTERAVGLVLAWYPVITALLVALMVYVTAVVTFDDQRVGLASLAIFAVTPVVAYRMSLGFGDHHAFDYIWVALGLLSLVVLANERADWQTVTLRRVAGTTGLSIAVAAQVHAWRGGPLLILPIAAYVAVRVASDVRTDRSPIAANAWAFGGLLLAAIFAYLPHVAFGWSGFYRTFAPVLLFGGALIVAGVAEGVWRMDQSAKVALAVEIAGGLAIGLTVWFGLPPIRSALQEGLRYFGVTGQTAIAETYSLLSPELGGIFGPILFFGLAFFFGFGALIWTSWRLIEETRPGWLVVTVYAWVLLGGALVQLRFAGQFAVVLSLFSGLAFVYLAAVTDITDLPRPFVVTNEQDAERQRHIRGEDSDRVALSLPSRRGILSVGVLFLLISGMGIVQTPVKTSQLTVNDATFDAATGIDQHAAAENVTWPGNYVFSEWGRNRVYNYIVNGHSRSYWYAQEYYEDFVTSSNPERWYRQLSRKPTGYVVMQQLDGNFSSASMQTRLWQHWGSASVQHAGVGHYRAVYANDERKVFELVEGAMVVGEGTPGERVTVSTQFAAGGSTHTYERRVNSTASGWYAVRVPYNGTYQTAAGSQQVSETAVQNGGFAGPTGDSAHWPLNASRGNVAFDVRGGHHGWVRGASWTDSGLSFDGNDSVVVPSGESVNVEGDFTLSVTFRTRDGVDYVNKVQFPRLAGTAPPSRFANTSGFQIAMRGGHILGAVGDGSDAAVIQGQRVDDGNRHTARLVREGNTVTLYLDGQIVGQEQYAGTVTSRDAFAIGSIPGGPRGFEGAIRNVTFLNEQ